MFWHQCISEQQEPVSVITTTAAVTASETKQHHGTAQKSSHQEKGRQAGATGCSDGPPGLTRGSGVGTDERCHLTPPAMIAQCLFHRHRAQLHAPAILWDALACVGDCIVSVWGWRGEGGWGSTCGLSGCIMKPLMLHT